MATRKRVAIVRNPDKPEARAVLASVVACFQGYADVVGTGVIDDTLELARHNPDRVIVLGGDGSILAVARAMNSHQAPIVGVNFGKLGYLAEFSVQDVEQHAEAILNDDGIVSRRMMLHATVRRPEVADTCSVAVNDCVVQAGPPYRLVELSICVGDEQITTLMGDGLIVSTPTGSTAHNMSAGGPIVQSEVSALVLTPILPHSLTHRPVVVSGGSSIRVIARQVNPGTTVAVDGQLSVPLRTGDELIVRRHERDFLLARNPTRTAWCTLITKLKWGQ